jgi:peptide/nickel transport system substrate-binding protein
MHPSPARRLNPLSRRMFLHLGGLAGALALLDACTPAPSAAPATAPPASAPATQPPQTKPTAPPAAPAATSTPPTNAPAATSAPVVAAPAGPAVAPGAAGTLVIAIDSDPQSLDPSTNLGYPVGSEIIINVFDTLLAWNAPDYTTLEGRLAEKWDVSADGKTYTLAIRQGVNFHDGTPLDAPAVKAAMERVKADNSFMSAYYGPIQSIDAPDARTLTITLKDPIAPFLAYLAVPQAAIHSPTNAQKYTKDQIGMQAVGTGPYRLESYNPNSDVTLVANPNYFRGAPSIGRIVYRVIPDQATRRLELEKGTVDVVQQNGNLFSLPVADITALQANKDVRVLSFDSQILRYIQFNNTDSELMKDQLFRQAITLAIDYDGLVNGVLGNTAARAYGPLPSSNWAALPNAQDLAPKRDLNKAKDLLAQAGKTGVNLKLPTFQGSSWRDIGTFLQANLADVGVNLDIQQLEFPPLRDLITSGKHDLTLGGRQPWYNDPDAHITIDYLSSLGPTALTFRMPPNAELDGLIQKAQQGGSQDERKATYADIQRRLIDYAPGAWLFVPKIIIYTRANITSLSPLSAPPLTEYFRVQKA